MMIHLICRRPGTIEIKRSVICNAADTGTCDCGALAHYIAYGSVDMHDSTRGYDHVIRPNGKKIAGGQYTGKMAENDYYR